MTELKRGMIIDVNLNPTLGSETGKTRPCIIVTNDVYNTRVPVIQVVPITEWNEKKSRILTNIEIQPTKENGLTKLSIADCLQTRPIDYRQRIIKKQVFKTAKKSECQKTQQNICYKRLVFTSLFSLKYECQKTNVCCHICYLSYQPRVKIISRRRGPSGQLQDVHREAAGARARMTRNFEFGSQNS